MLAQGAKYQKRASFTNDAVRRKKFNSNTHEAELFRKDVEIRELRPRRGISKQRNGPHMSAPGRRQISRLGSKEPGKIQKKGKKEELGRSCLWPRDGHFLKKLI